MPGALVPADLSAKVSSNSRRQNDSSTIPAAGADKLSPTNPWEIPGKSLAERRRM